MKVYVGNLPFSVDREGLQKLFSPYGEMEEVIVISDKFSGRSKGFGFVTFKDEESAKKAIAEMNEKEVEGRNLKVNEAKPMDPDRPRQPRRNFSGGNKQRRF
jgi:RNA recognition motif-containing protein